MKITKVDVMQVKTPNPSWRPILCRVYTDEGIYGDGEAALAYGIAAPAAFGMIRDLAALIIGMDPLDNEVVWDTLYKNTFWGQNGGPVVFAGISAIDLEADITKALENNYSLKILEKQISHAVSTSNRESLEQSYKNQKEVVANSVKTAYQDLILAKEDYVQAQQSYESESSTMAAADRKLLAGTMTRNDYQKQKSSFTTAEVNVRTKKLALLTAQVNYDWAVDGLASVS